MIRLNDTTPAVFYTFRTSAWLEKDQVTVGEVAPFHYLVKAPRTLTEDEIKGAIVKYVLKTKH